MAEFNMRQTPPILLGRLEPVSSVPQYHGNKYAGLYKERKNFPLLLVRAAPGYGRTSLLTWWHRELLSEGGRVAWLSAGEGSNSQFLPYLVSSLEHAVPGIARVTQALLMTDSALPESTLLTVLINELHGLEEPLTLIIDDADRLTSGATDQGFNFLINNLPGNLRLVLGCRSVKNFRFALLWAHGQVKEINARDLRLNTEECRDHISACSIKGISPLVMRQIAEHTGGWMTGIQFAVELLRSGVEPEQLSTELAGSQLLHDYIQEVVLEGLPAEAKRFLFSCSVLDELDTVLCQQVSGSDDSENWLEYFVEQQLFVTPVDGVNRGYRFDPLFKSYLQSRLKRESSERIKDLNSRAARVFRERRQFDRAAEHSLAAGSLDEAIEAITACAGRLVNESQVDCLAKWIGQLPKHRFEQELPLRLTQAWSICLMMRPDESTRVLEDLEQWAAEEGYQVDQDAEFTFQTIRAANIAVMDDWVTAAKICKPLMELVNEEGIQRFSRASASSVMAYSYVHQGEFEKAYETYQLVSEEIGDIFPVIYKRAALGIAEVIQGRIQQGMDYYRRCRSIAVQHAGYHSIAAILPAALMAEIHYEQNRLDVLQQELLEREDVFEHCAADGFLRAYTALIQTAAARGRLEDIPSLLERMTEHAKRMNWSRVQSAAMYQGIHYHLMQKDLEKARAELEHFQKLIKRRDFRQQLPVWEGDSYLRLAEAEMSTAIGRSEEAIKSLKQALSEHENARKNLWANRFRLQLVRALIRARKRDEAEAELCKSLEFGKRAGLLRSYLDAGFEVFKLLRELRGSLPEHLAGYAAELLELETVESQKATETVEPGLTPAGARYQLSQREDEMLTLLAKGLSNKEMARLLSISLETVKWHLKNLYAKLEVGSRTEAISLFHEEATDA